MWLIRYFCVNIVQNNNILVEQCALTHKFFGNDQGVHLLEHVR